MPHAVNPAAKRTDGGGEAVRRDGEVVGEHQGIRDVDVPQGVERFHEQGRAAPDLHQEILVQVRAVDGDRKDTLRLAGEVPIWSTISVLDCTRE